MNDPRFAEYDECPACKKSVKHMFEEHKKLMHMGGIFIVCLRCGCVFLPKSQIKYLMDATEHRIIDPNSPQGQIIQAGIGGEK